MPGTYDLVAQYSLGGMGDADFHALATLAMVTPGDPFSIVDSPVPPGQLRLYRARYVCRADPTVFSEWAYTFGRGPYPAGDATMSEVITSARTMVAVSNPERTPGQQCKAQNGLDFRTHDMNAERTFAEQKANRNTVASVTTRKSGVTTISGNMSLDFKPGGGFLRLLLASYYLQSANVATTVADPPVPEYYTQTVSASHSKRPVTVITKEGDSACVFAGCQLNRFRYTAQKTQNTVIGADVEIMGLNKLIYDAVTSNDLAMLGLDVAGYDLLEPLGPVEWELSINGTVAPCEQHSLDVNFNLGQQQVGKKKQTGPRSLFPLKTDVNGTASLYFEDLAQYRDYYGIADNTVTQFGVKETIIFESVVISYTPVANADGYTNDVTLTLPICTVMSIVKQVPENGAIMQQLTWGPQQDPANGRVDHIWTFINGETYANLTDVGEEIAYAMDNDVQPYKAIPGLTSGSPTTTSIVAAAQFLGKTYLSAVDDTYNGKSLRIISGALAGQVRTISDYVGSTRTFTVAAFGSAPLANVRFQILDVDPN